ncbi:hypothetical protein [Actinoplanes sp. N902-109]|uniref:hypothetical protein n=1 Tax=Actinoplanes sp. (strain N902-109) TaxID=649831 RepID=UPI0003293958|nr:hypothetical protein [Actinoplanes sp. N902-109]AGL19483.1 hypothetical protein L083_5973 [Actinoplanes sp. N902-109]
MDSYDPAVAKAMELITEEASRQGFQVTQHSDGTWRVTREGQVLLLQVVDALGVLKALSLLISAGLDWPHQG